MSRSALRYLVYGYIGRRTRNTEGLGIDKPAPGFRFCLYDSEQVHSESNCPVIPAIKDPVFSIEENTAGSMDFTLLADGESEIWYNSTAGGTPVVRTTTLQDSSHNPLPASPEKLFNYILPKQTEIVLYRRMLVGQSYVTKELWAGRVDTIKKDFYNNWSIYVEGELTYLNDVALSEIKLTNVTEAKQVFTTIISTFNNKINAIPPSAKTITFTVPDPSEAVHTPSDVHSSTYTVDQIPRLFNVGTIDTPTLPAVAMSSDLDKTFTIGDGATAWSALQSCLDKYGGHIEMRRDKTQTDTRIIDWRISGTYNSNDGHYNWNGYHTFNNNTSQIIEFGINLLDFSEELDTSDLYTVLIPHGQAVVTTTTNADGTTTSTTGPALTIANSNKMYKGKEYIYYPRHVETYGWIEKVETWNVTDPTTLYELALAYYRDLRIGSRSITIKAYDLKNLISVPSDQYAMLKPAETDAWANKLKQLESLYLYDVVYVRSTAHANHGRELVGQSQLMPIKGIKIPLDKFPTDTEYTISNGIKKRNILAPGSVSQIQPQQPTVQPDPTPGGDDPTPVTPEDPLPTIDPIGSVVGTDADFLHYPPVYLDRAFKYITAPIELYTGNNGKKERATVTVMGSLQTYMYDSTRGEWVPYDPSNGKPIEPIEVMWWYQHSWNATPQYSTEYYCMSTGYNGDNASISGGEGISSTTTAPGSVYFTGNLPKIDAMTRLRTAHENKINWYEQVLGDTEPHSDSELQPFVSANSSYYSEYAEANVKPGQPWSGFATTHADAPRINWSDPQRLAEGYDVSTVIGKIKSLAFNGTTVGGVINLEDMRMQIMPSATSANHLDLVMYYKAPGTNNEYTIRRQMIEWRPTTFESGYEYYYIVGIAECAGSNNAGSSGLLYYTYYKTEIIDELSSDYWDLKMAQAVGNFAKVGFLKPTYEIAAEDFTGFSGNLTKYYTTVTETYGAYTGEVYVPSTTPGSTTDAYAATNNYLADDGGGGIVGVKRAYTSAFMRALYNQNGVDLARKLLAALVIYDQVRADSVAAQNAATAGRNLAEAKARCRALPFMVITTVSSMSSASVYGVIPFSLNDSGSLGLSHNEGDAYYTLTGITSIDPNNGGSPLMICKDSLFVTNYLFYETQSYGETVLSVSNARPIPRWGSSSPTKTPIMCMTKCGGLQTDCVAGNAYFRLSGDTKTSHCYGENVIYPQQLSAPGSRNMIQRTAENDHDKVWYEGSDMKNPSDFSGFVSLDNASVEKISEFFISTRGRQPVTIGGKYFARVTPHLFVEYQP